MTDGQNGAKEIKERRRKKAMEAINFKNSKVVES